MQFLSRLLFVLLVIVLTPIAFLAAVPLGSLWLFWFLAFCGSRIHEAVKIILTGKVQDGRS